MKVSLEDYQPLGTEVLIKPNIKTLSEGGVILGKEKVDRWFEVIKVGPMVDNVLSIGDYVVFDMAMSPQMTLTFDKELYVQINMHSIKGKVPIKTNVLENMTIT